MHDPFAGGRAPGGYRFLNPWRNALPEDARMNIDFSKARTGPTNAQLGDDFEEASGQITDHADFRRVFSLPRKRKKDWEQIALELTAQLRTPGGTWSLRPIQAEVLVSVAENLGTFASVGVGGGKTIMSYLAGTVCDVRSVCVIVPAKLREKTRRDFKALSEQFLTTSQITVLSAEECGLKDGMERLERTRAQLLVIDECHKFKNPKAARTRKVLRYLEQHPECKLLAMSGTVTDRSIKNFAHLLRHALGELNCPLPVDKEWLGKWARLVDPKVQSRVRPGVFVQKLPKGTDPRLADAEDYRKIVHHRVFNTPGVVKLPSTSYGGPIEMSILDPGVSEKADKLIRQLESQGVHPNGDPIYPIERYGVHRCLALDFWYDWHPRPPEHWLRARRAWRSWCASVLETEIYGLDSELMVINAVDRGWYLREPNGEHDEPDPENPDDQIEVTDDGLLEAWRAVKNDYKGKQIPVWESEETLRKCIEMSGALENPMLIWTEFRAVGEKLGELYGLPYFANKGMTKDKSYIGDCPGDVSPVLSLAANSEGLNLQDRWHRALYLTPMQSPSLWEQSIGRIHRPGQEADACELQVVINTERLHDAFLAAREYARYQETMTGAPQKLLLADMA